MKGGVLINPDEYQRAVQMARRNGKYTPGKDNLKMESSLLSSAFASFDLDKDGYIAKEELRVCLAVAGKPIREDMLDEMIRLADRDGDGRISLDDFVNFFSGSKLPVPILKSQDLPIPEPLVARTASQLELISETELMQMDSLARRKKTGDIVLALIGGADSIRPKDIKQLYRRFTQLDTRKLGRLSMLQFNKIFDGFSFSGSRKVRSNYLNLLFAFCDADKSNFIDAKEFMTALCWLGTFGSIDKLRFTFMLFDTSGDGVLDRGEMTTFIASINIGSLTSKQEVGNKVDEIFQKIAREENFADWQKFTLTFEHLLRVAEENPDLFTSVVA